MPARQVFDELIVLENFKFGKNFLDFGFKIPGFQVIHFSQNSLHFLGIYQTKHGPFVVFDRLDHRIVRIKNGIQNGVCFIEFGLLHQVTNPDVAPHQHTGIFTLRRFDTRNHAQQGTFAGAVFCHQRDFLPFADLKGNIVE